MQLGSLPGSFVHSLHPTDQDVGAEPAHVSPERGYRPVGRHQVRQDVEALGAVAGFEPRIGTRCLFAEREDLRTPPRQFVHKRLPIRTEGRFKAKQVTLPPRGADSLRPADVDDLIFPAAVIASLGVPNLPTRVTGPPSVAEADQPPRGLAAERLRC